jgi:mono/diheme cytochrome c family protein
MRRSTACAVPALMFAAALAVLWFSAAASVVAADAKTVWNGVYTAEQAARGKVVFEANCAMCHRADLTGERGPALAGEGFMRNYEADNLGRLFTAMSRRMPQNAPATLKENEYIDVVAYVLQVNAFPAGTEPITSDVALLRSIQVVRKGGPTTAPNFALVRLVGCLTQGADNAWVVTNASEPVVTKDPKPSKDSDFEAAKDRPLGTQAFKLMGVDEPVDAHQGRKVEIKGLLIRGPSENRVNIVSGSLQMVTPACQVN